MITGWKIPQAMGLKLMSVSSSMASRRPPPWGSGATGTVKASSMWHTGDTVTSETASRKVVTAIIAPVADSAEDKVPAIVRSVTSVVRPIVWVEAFIRQWPGRNNGTTAQ